MRKEMSRNDKTYSDKEPDHWAGIPKICVPLTGTTREKICQEAEDAKKQLQIWWNGVQISLKN